MADEELFFDLIFVAVIIELGDFLKPELTLVRISETAMIFIASWLTWFHMVGLQS